MNDTTTATNTSAWSPCERIVKYGNAITPVNTAPVR
jgi:hypothetical protein